MDKEPSGKIHSEKVVYQEKRRCMSSAPSRTDVSRAKAQNEVKTEGNKCSKNLKRILVSFLTATNLMA